MFAPWDAWPRSTSLILVPPAFALIAFGNLYGGRAHTYGVFFVIAFVWIGLAHGPCTSLAVAPLAIVATRRSCGRSPCSSTRSSRGSRGRYSRC